MDNRYIDLKNFLTILEYKQKKSLESMINISQKFINDNKRKYDDYETIKNDLIKYKKIEENL